MRRFVNFLVWVAAILGAVIGLLRLVAIRWWELPDNDPYLGASVTPTLRGGDWVLTWRLTRPKFGDLVICPEPGHPERLVVGRLMGEAGDNVAIEGSLVRVNGKQAELEHHCERFKVNSPESGAEVEQECQIEAVGGAAHRRGATTGFDVKQPPVEHHVEEGRVFLVSDNRLFPYDSRDFGSVPRESCTEWIFFRLVGRGGYYDAESRFTYIQ